MAGERKVTFRQMLDYIQLFAQHTPAAVDRGKDSIVQRTLVFSENREGWLYAFYSIWENAGIPVPVDASSTPGDVAYILRDCRPTAAWTSRQCLPVLQQAVSESQVPVEIHLIDDYETAACPAHTNPMRLEVEDLCTFENHDCALIIYTSGTTGSPKGVMLSFANLQANLWGVTHDVHIFTAERRTMILLPLHHILPLVGTAIAPILAGGGVAICPALSGPAIMETLQRAQIGIFIGVPRLWQMIFAGIKKKLDGSAITRGLFNLCARIDSPALSRLVFGAVHRKMGGHLAYCVSGGAALDAEIGRGLRTLGINMLEGYGMTETAPIISFTRPGDIIPGCVGLPLQAVDIRIVEGEICAKGPNVMLGYYNRPEETAAVIDSEGYVHTGDLGRLDEQGRIHITGRCKEIIVLSNGKNIQPNEIEYKLEKHAESIKEVAVTQDGDQLCAIIVPQEAWAQGKTRAEMEESLKREVLNPYNASVVNYKKVMNLFVFQGELPRTRMEKIQRFKLKDILAQRDNDVQPQATPEVADPDMQEYRILRDYIEAEKHLKVKATDHLETDLALDSLDFVSLQGFVEQTFGVIIQANTFASYPNIKALAEHIARTKTHIDTEETDWHSIITADSSSLVLPRTSFTFPLLSGLFRNFLSWHNHLRVIGAERIPADGPFILAPNHESYIDGPIVVSGMNRKTLVNSYFYATEEHVRGAFRRYMAAHNNIILMEKGDLKNSILRLAEVLKQGRNIVIFPEGHRTHDGEVSTFKKTFAILSQELQVPIVPVRITGAFAAMPRGSRFPCSHPITVEYLTPIQPRNDETYEQLADRVRSAIVQ